MHLNYSMRQVSDNPELAQLKNIEKEAGMEKRWVRRPEGSNWGDFGEDDQIGRLNWVTAERRLIAFEEVKCGLVFPLSLPLDFPGGELQPDFRHPPKLSSTVGMHNLNVSEAYGAPGHPDIANDDVVLLCTQYSTQWDSLCHVGSHFDANGDGVAEPVYYNGYGGADYIHTQDDAGHSRAAALSIDNMALSGVQGRGVLINLLSVYGSAKHIVGYEDLMRIIEAQKVTVEKGDFLCLYSGFADLVLDMNRQPNVARLRNSFADLNGYDERLLQWITDSGIVAICADNQAVECHPDTYAKFSLCKDKGKPFFPLHHHCLFKLGIHLGEFWYFKNLAKWLQQHERSRFLLTAPPLNLQGAVGSPVTPIATV